MQPRLALSLAAAAAVAAIFPASASAQRVTGIDVSAWQGNLSQTHWNTIHRPTDESVGGVFGDGKDFAFIRSSRGGTTGYYNQSDPNNNNNLNTFSQRYDDPYFPQNIHRATTAGMLAGPYHFGRMDIIASTQNSGGIANNGTDEANHFMEMAGSWMRPGYMLPVFDLEAGISQRTATELAQFAIDFSNRIFAVKGIRPAVYIGGNYANDIESSPIDATVVAAYPTLWSARWPNQADPDSIPIQTSHPKDTYTPIYGPWDNAPNPTHPWDFWQYASTGRLNGINNGNSNVDLDVAHGGIEFVKDHLVPALWLTNSSGNWETDANWNSGETPEAPIYGPGQVLPPPGSVILPTVRAPGETSEGVNDTVILDRAGGNITVTHASGTHNIRKLFMRETLNITGGSLFVNYVPHPDSTPISAQFSGAVTLSGGSFSVHTLQVDATRTFALNGGTLTLDRINLMPGATAAKINIGGNVTFSQLDNAASIIDQGAGGGSSTSVNLTGGTRTLAVSNGTAATDLLIDVPVNNGSLIKTGSGTLAMTNAALTSATVSAGILEVPTGATLNVANALTADGTGTLRVRGTATADQLLATRPIEINGGRINIPSNGTAAGMSRVNHQLNILGGGELDLNNNDLIVDYTESTINPYANLRAWVINGDVMSTAANTAGDTTIAVVDNAEWGELLFNGASIDDTTVLGKYTYFGDANLDGMVTSDDYVSVDVGIGTGDSWIEGDFDYSGDVSSDDYVAIDVNLGKGTSSPLALAELKAEMIALHTDMFGAEYLDKIAFAEANGFQIVPEPGSLGLLGLGATALLRRRRR